MGRRAEARIAIAVPVRVSGIDAKGNTFTESACTLDLSQRGVRLDRADFLRAPGQRVVLQHKESRATFIVAWIGELGSARHGQAGLRLANPAEQSWALAMLLEQAAARAEAKTAPQVETGEESLNYDRRGQPRFQTDRGVQCWKQGQNVPVYGKLRDLSMQGCYVETKMPLEAGTRVRLLIIVSGVRVRAEGEVRSCQAQAGMGVMFTGFMQDDQPKLEALVNRMATGTPGPVRPLTSPEKRVLQEIEMWFQSHESLDREQFLRLLRAQQPVEPAPVRAQRQSSTLLQ
jgi:hypothetical protein